MMSTHVPGSHTLSVALVAAVVVLGGCRSSRSGPAPGSPAAPSNLTGELDGSLKVSLHWVDNSSDETSFEIYGTGGGEDWAVVGTVPADTTSHVVGPGRYDAVYTFVVVAKNDSGQSHPTNRLEIKTPPSPIRGRSGCGLILSDFGIGAVKPSLAPTGASNSLCLFSAAEAISVDEVADYGRAGGQVVLHGRGDDAVIAGIRRWVEGDTIHLECEVEWRNPPPVEDWEVCLAVHDPSTSDVRALLSQRGVSRWVPQKINLPVIGRFPIQAGRAYAVRFEIDRLTSRYTVHVDGVPLATGVSLDRILVMPARVIRADGPRPHQRVASAGR